MFTLAFAYSHSNSTSITLPSLSLSLSLSTLPRVLSPRLSFSLLFALLFSVATSKGLNPLVLQTVSQFSSFLFFSFYSDDFLDSAIFLSLSPDALIHARELYGAARK